MVITLTDGDLESARGIGTSLMTNYFHRGEVRFVHGPIVHRLRNPEGLGTHRNITVEMLKGSEQPYNYPSTPQSRQDYDVVPPPVDSHVSYQAVLDRDTLRASSVQILPGESMVVAKGFGPLLVVALEDLELEPEGGQMVKHNRDDVLWDPEPFRRKLTNISSRPARFIMLEFRSPGGAASADASCTAIGANASISSGLWCWPLRELLAAAITDEHGTEVAGSNRASRRSGIEVLGF
jgi:hypothetical protein